MMNSGSSPLARGLRHTDATEPPRGRIIPARAGFTSSRPTPLSRRADHPRSRGVYVYLHGRQGRSAGSSPLARGLHPKLL